MDVFSAEYRGQRLRKVSVSAVPVWLWLWWHCDGGFRCLGSSASEGIDDVIDIAIVLNLDDMINAA
jgi:hypothetical protein